MKLKNAQYRKGKQMKNLLIEKIMGIRLDMDSIGIEYEEIEDAYNYLYTLTNKELLEILICIK